MNEQQKEFMKKQKKMIVDSLKKYFPTIPLFEDEMAEDEEKEFIKNKKYLAFVLSMGDFTPSNLGNLTQSFSIDYYSEDRDDVDETLIDIISLVEKIPTVSFVRTTKMRARAANTDRFVDVVTLDFRRFVKYECRV
ncbi:hypothetical protein [Bacillus sp. FJAT-49736]|uniref:hypothetical protein n=1 Tax=Bacillus sp. FJAT-49736 TaxID=2833582 RepID=UPI001BC930CF|nr:hypothetical protein [Bacillus sp. FJAT-49736]MBS4171941.1 hypothetical protein [Bacillus sp. FJAT-49736]